LDRALCTCRSHFVWVEHVQQARVLVEVEQRPQRQGGREVCRVHRGCGVHRASQLMEQFQIVCQQHKNKSIHLYLQTPQDRLP
jgi:hypothetical protein